MKGPAVIASLGVMVSKELSDFDKTIAALPLNFVSDLQMQSLTRFRQQTLVERVPDQGMLENIGIRDAVGADEVQRLHFCQQTIEVFHAIDRGG